MSLEFLIMFSCTILPRRQSFFLFLWHYLQYIFWNIRNFLSKTSLMGKIYNKSLKISTTTSIIASYSSTLGVFLILVPSSLASPSWEKSEYSFYIYSSNYQQLPTQEPPPWQLLFLMTLPQLKSWFENFSCLNHLSVMNQKLNFCPPGEQLIFFVFLNSI